MDKRMWTFGNLEGDHLYNVGKSEPDHAGTF